MRPILKEKLDLLCGNKSWFIETARKTDLANVFPVESLNFLKENGFLGLIVPAKYGGSGLNFAEYQTFLQELGSVCPSTAAAFNMHCIILASLTTLPLDTFSRKQRETVIPFVEFVYSEVVERKKVFASATSEPGIGARYSQTKATYELNGESFVLNGTKSFVSMAEYADYFSLIANKHSKSNEIAPRHSLSFFIVPASADGITIEKNWHTLGMRATQSQVVHFKGTKIPRNFAFLGLTGFALSSVFNTPNWIIGGYMGVYLGIMKAALNDTIKFIADRTSADSGLGNAPLIQARLADMYNLYSHAKLAVEHSAKLVDKDPLDKETHRSVYLAKYVVGENVTKVTSMAIKTCGGSALSKSMDFERYYRDARCGALMPAVSDVCQLYVGRSLLQLPTDDLW